MPIEQCSMIRGTPIKPHYAVPLIANNRPHLTKVLEPVGADKFSEAEPMHPKPTWENSQTKLTDPKVQHHEPHAEFIFRENGGAALIHRSGRDVLPMVSNADRAGNIPALPQKGRHQKILVTR